MSAAPTYIIVGSCLIASSTETHVVTLDGQTAVRFHKLPDIRRDGLILPDLPPPEAQRSGS